MGLLSPIDKANIRAAIKLATDTFMVTPVSYSMAGESVDRFNEDRTDQLNTVYPLLGLVEDSELETYFTRREGDGSVERADVKVSFNLADLMTATGMQGTTPVTGGIINGDFSINFNMARDMFTTQGVVYKVVSAGVDGPLDQQAVLVVIYGEVKQQAV